MPEAAFEVFVPSGAEPFGPAGDADARVMVHLEPAVAGPCDQAMCADDVGMGAAGQGAEFCLEDGGIGRLVSLEGLDGAHRAGLPVASCPDDAPRADSERAFELELSMQLGRCGLGTNQAWAPTGAVRGDRSGAGCIARRLRRWGGRGWRRPGGWCVARRTRLGFERIQAWIRRCGWGRGRASPAEFVEFGMVSFMVGSSRAE